MVAVTKGHGASTWALAAAAGCDGIGENYAQELLAKWPFRDETVLPVHFIGSVQSNKVGKIAAIVDVWHGLDRPSVIDAVARRTVGAANVVGGPRVFVQVNATGEASKAGCEPRATGELVSQCRDLGLDVAGLMTMGPADADPVRSREAFRRVRDLADDLGLTECSMGMSDDFETAVACGSTLVRLGTALFGARSA